MSTNIAIELPDDIARALREKWGDLSQHTIEALAAECYRTRALSGAQVQRMLGLETRMEVDAFLKALRESHLRSHIGRWTVQPGEVIPGRKGFSIR